MKNVMKVLFTFVVFSTVLFMVSCANPAGGEPSAPVSIDGVYGDKVGDVAVVIEISSNSYNIMQSGGGGLFLTTHSFEKISNATVYQAGGDSSTPIPTVPETEVPLDGYELYKLTVTESTLPVASVGTISYVLIRLDGGSTLLQAPAHLISGKYYVVFAPDDEIAISEQAEGFPKLDSSTYSASLASPVGKITINVYGNIALVSANRRSVILTKVDRIPEVKGVIPTDPAHHTNIILDTTGWSLFQNEGEDVYMLFEFTGNNLNIIELSYYENTYYAVIKSEENSALITEIILTRE